MPRRCTAAEQDEKTSEAGALTKDSAVTILIEAVKKKMAPKQSPV